MFMKQWSTYETFMKGQVGRIVDIANMLAVQECSDKVWNLIKDRTGWVGHRHEEGQAFGLLWDPKVTWRSS